MPANMAWSTNISGTTTGGSVNLSGSGSIDYARTGGTGVGHFGQFDITKGDTVNLKGANQYVNMVDNLVNIQGTLNALRNGGGEGYANTIFISPKGMVVGASGVMNVGGLQVITPTTTDYNNFVGKGLSAISVEDASALSAAATDKTSGAAVNIEGKIYSMDDVVIKADGNILFVNGSLITTNKSVGEQVAQGDISLFSNTGDILFAHPVDNGVVIDANGNLTLNAKNGGVTGQRASTNEFKTLNVKVSEGNKLNVTVSDSICPDNQSYTGIANVTNNTTNLKLGEIKGNDVTITNAGTGEMTSTQALTGYRKAYFNAKNGKLNLSHDVSAKEIVRLNGKNEAKTTGNINVADNGYVSVYSENGNVDIADVTIKQGNVDIKSKKGNVAHGNVTISQRGKYSDYTRLRDNSKVETFVGAPDTFRTDGVAITAGGNITQKAGTKINSAGRVDMVAGGSVDHTVKAGDLINVQAGGNAKLATLDTARLGDVSGSTVTVTGSNIIVDGKVKGSSKVDITATDKVTIRPRTKLDSTHNTYGAIEAIGDVNVTANNGIFATEQRTEGAMITSTAGSVNLNATGDIYTKTAEPSAVTVSAANETNANADNIILRLMHTDGGVGTIAATGDALITADGDVNVSNAISADTLGVFANNNIKQSASGAAFVSTGDMTLASTNGNVGMSDGYLTVDVGNKLNAAAGNGSIYINSNKGLNVASATANREVNLRAQNALNVDSAKSGTNMSLTSNTNNVTAKVEVGGELDASGNNVAINSDKHQKRFKSNFNYNR